MTVKSPTKGGWQRHCCRSQRGAFLIDAMIALFVSVAVLLATVSVFTSALLAASSARQNDLAYNAARQVVENIRGSQGSSVANGTNMDARTNFSPVPQLDQMTQGTGTVTIAPWNNSSKVKCVAVTIQWYDGHKIASKTLTALVGQNGVAR